MKLSLFALLFCVLVPFCLSLNYPWTNIRHRMQRGFGFPLRRSSNHARNLRTSQPRYLYYGRLPNGRLYFKPPGTQAPSAKVPPRRINAARPSRSNSSYPFYYMRRNGQRRARTGELSDLMDRKVAAFLGGIIPALQPRVGSLANSINDAVKTRIMNGLEQTNRTLLGVESFLTNLARSMESNEQQKLETGKEGNWQQELFSGLNLV